MNDEVLGILVAWGLQREERWLFEQGVFCVGDLKYLDEDWIKGRDDKLKFLVADMKDRK